MIPSLSRLTSGHTAGPERHRLSAARPSDGAAAAGALHQGDVGGLGGAGKEPDAGLLVVSLHGSGDHTSLFGPELAGYHVGNFSVRPLFCRISDGISVQAVRLQCDAPQVNVSLKQTR